MRDIEEEDRASFRNWLSVQAVKTIDEAVVIVNPLWCKGDDRRRIISASIAAKYKVKLAKKANSTKNVTAPVKCAVPPGVPVGDSNELELVKKVSREDKDKGLDKENVDVNRGFIPNIRIEPHIDKLFRKWKSRGETSKPGELRELMKKNNVFNDLEKDRYLGEYPKEDEGNSRALVPITPDSPVLLMEKISQIRLKREAVDPETS